MPLNVLMRWFTTRDKNKTNTRIYESLVALDLGHLVFALGAHMLSFYFADNHFLEALWHEHFSKWGIPEFFNKRPIFKKNVLGNCGYCTIVWVLKKNTFEILWISITLLGLDFIPLEKLFIMLLNGLKRLVATFDKNQTKTHMDKLFIALDMGHWISSSWAHRMSFHFLNVFFWRISITRVFLSEE